MAVLLRKKKFGDDFPKKFDEYNIPYIVEGVNALFETSKKFYAEFILQDVFHNFLRRIYITEDSGNIHAEVILYNLGKFSQVIHDFETINFATLPKKIRTFLQVLTIYSK